MKCTARQLLCNAVTQTRSRRAFKKKSYIGQGANCNENTAANKGKYIMEGLRVDYANTPAAKEHGRLLSSICILA